MDEHEFAVTLEQRDGFAFSAAFEDPTLATIKLDEPPPLGMGSGPNAARVLAAAVGHCLSASLLFCLRKARIPVAGMRTTVRGTIVRNERGRFRVGRIAVEVDPRIDAGDRGRIERCLQVFEDFCIVTESIRRGIDVSVTMAGEDVTSGVEDRAGAPVLAAAGVLPPPFIAAEARPG